MAPDEALQPAEAAFDPAARASQIERAARVIATAWPLSGFVTANPLAELEDRPFAEAVAEARAVRGGRGYPAASTFREAWRIGAIAPDVLRRRLADAGRDPDPEAALEAVEAELAALPRLRRGREEDRVDRVLAKWLTAFLDEGQADRPMPGRHLGFYRAWRRLARHDPQVPGRARLGALADDPGEAIEGLLAGYGAEERVAIFRDHLAALPGWVARVKRRSAEPTPWRGRAPMGLEDLLAVRLALAAGTGAGVDPRGVALEPPAAVATPVAEILLAAWEQTQRRALTTALTRRAAAAGEAETAPIVDWVFCIDTRSEPMRRHLEAVGGHRTLGYAGFFGVPARIEGCDAERSHPACPPILAPKHHVRERPVADGGRPAAARFLFGRLERAARRLVDQLKHNVGAAFHFVESAGPAYGAAAVLRTLGPRALRGVRRSLRRRAPAPDDLAAPDLDGTHGEATDLPIGLAHEQRVAYAEAALALTGWSRPARLAVLVGHAGESVNNPFGDALHCGACAGRPGGPNARLLAAILNDPAVRAELAERGHAISDETLFVAGEHNTTTNELTLFEQQVPAERRGELAPLRRDWQRARAAAARERAPAIGAADGPSALAEMARRAGHWGEPRPEWGLAGNAAHVVGPRALTRGLDLAGRCFLHSYDWRADPDGSALAGILGGPGVVTQWINSHYYFATVDNGVYGSGSKITHSPVGNVGVVEGNGGDIATGLPLQSVADRDDHAFHAPLRLSIVVHAPRERVAEAVEGHDGLRALVSGGWITVTALDPTRDHEAIDVGARGAVAAAEKR